MWQVLPPGAQQASSTRCPGGQVQQVGGQLRGFVLHAHPAIGEAWQAAHVAGFGQHDAVWAVLAGAGANARFGQQRQVGIAAVVAAVDPQDHRRMGVVGGADGFPLLGPEGLERFLQPARVGSTHHRVALHAGEQFLTLTLGAAQHGIEQALGPGFLELVGTTDGLADGGVGRDAAVEQLVQAHQQQRLDIGVGRLEGLLQQLRGQQFEARLPAGGAEGQVLGQAAITLLDLVQLRGQ
ncbi:hypothetical protein P308_00125 [Pseudomonas piscis]|nr:hypothetical protein P308_00125 [Pseudomonas piscis]